MAKKLKVKTPQTTDGKNLAYDENKQVIYTESIVELNAKKEFESLNARLPIHLRNEFEEIDEEEADKAIADKAVQLEAVKAEADKAIADKDAEIAKLKEQLEKQKADKK